jgi:hypothetical protein
MEDVQIVGSELGEKIFEPLESEEESRPWNREVSMFKSFRNQTGGMRSADGCGDKNIGIS